MEAYVAALKELDGYVINDEKKERIRNTLGIDPNWQQTLFQAIANLPNNQ